LNDGKIRNRLDVDVPGEPRRGEQHEHDAGGQVAREFARGGGQPGGIQKAINLRQPITTPSKMVK
jgi:hypothetical protein